MAVTGTITTKFIDEKGVDLGRQLVEKDYLISVYPNLLPQFKSAGLFVWGIGSYGSIGNSTLVHRSSPVQTIATATNWKQASHGYYFKSAIKTDGTLWLWGRNNLGQLGDNTISNKSSPIQTISGGTNWLQVSNGYNHCAAIKTDGTLWLWGANDYGKLGDNSIIHRSSPVQEITASNNWKSVICSSFNTAAIKNDGTLWLWGRNSYGNLGDNTLVHRSSPVQTISAGTNWSSISSSDNLFGAIKSDGTLWMWGRNFYGMFGDNTYSTFRSSPIQTVAGGTNWKYIICSKQHTVAIKQDGTLWTWGSNYGGSLGTNTTTMRSSPGQTICFGNNWKYATTNRDGTYAIKTDGTLWVWGSNGYGKLGDNTTVNKSSPIQIVIGVNTWKSLSIGDSSQGIMAIRDFNY